MRVCYFFITCLAVAGLLFPLHGSLSARNVYISVRGDDGHSGGVDAPFRTLSRASATLGPGDTCFISGGIYRETLRPSRSGMPGRPVVYMGLPGERVTISAMESLGSGEKHGSLIHFSPNWDLGYQNSVHCNGVPLTLARWPDKERADPMDPEGAVIDTEKSNPSEIHCPGFPGSWESGSLEGAAAWVNAECKWSSWTSHINGFDPARKVILLRGFGDNWWVNNHHNPGRVSWYGEGIFYVAGAEALLNAPGEWFLDRESSTLKLIMPEGKQPTDCLIEMKKRIWTIDLSGLSNIHVINTDLSGAPVNLTGAFGCLLQGSEIRDFYSSFGSHSPQSMGEASGILLGGHHNTIRDCSISGSSGDGIRITGEGNRVVNCDIFHINYLGCSGSSPVSLTGKDQLVSHNSIHDAGRECIIMSGGGHEISHNRIYNPGRISEDLGALKCGWNDGDNIVIHHNLIFNDNNKFIGIYFDSYANNFIAHHNLIWGWKDGIRSNRPGHYHIIFNNTVIPDINNSYGPWEGAYDQHGNVVVNNVYRDTLMVKPEVVVSGNLKADLQLAEERVYPVFKGGSELADFPSYRGAVVPGNPDFRAGHNFDNPPEAVFNPDPPFVRNHVRNGCFDFDLTYGEVTDSSRFLADPLACWKKKGEGKVSAVFSPETSGYLDVSNPENRLCICNNSLCLKGRSNSGVTQTITTLRPGRKYVLGAYFHSPDKVPVEFTIEGKGTRIAAVSTDRIGESEKSKWKFVRLEFALDDQTDRVKLSIIKKGEGTAWIDDVGILPVLQIP